MISYGGGHWLRAPSWHGCDLYFLRIHNVFLSKKAKNNSQGQDKIWSFLIEGLNYYVYTSCTHPSSSSDSSNLNLKDFRYKFKEWFLFNSHKMSFVYVMKNHLKKIHGNVHTILPKLRFEDNPSKLKTLYEKKMCQTFVVI